MINFYYFAKKAGQYPLDEKAMILKHKRDTAPMV